MLHSIKTLIKYCEAILNVFLTKKNFDDDKKFYLHD